MRIGSFDMKPSKTQALLIGGSGIGLICLIGFFAIQRYHLAQSVESTRKALVEGRLEDASEAIQDWLRRDPQSAEAEYWLALLELKQGRAIETLNALQLAGDQGYDRGKLAILTAIVGCRGGQFQSAERVLRPAFESNEEPRVEIAESLSRLYLSSYRLQEATLALDRWVELAPDDPQPYIWRHEIYQRLEADPIQMVRNLRRALELDPSHDQARLLLADLLLTSHMNDEAEVEFEAYLARNPESAQAHAGLGQILSLKGDIIKATKEFEKVLELEPENLIALQQLSLIDLRSNRPEAACSRLKKGIELSPFDINLHYNYASALRLTGNIAQADQEIATTERLRKELDDVAELRKELLTYPEDYDRKAEVMKWLIEHGQEKEALKWSELILGKRPKHRKTCEILAGYYERTGQSGLANYYRTLALASAP